MNKRLKALFISIIVILVIACTVHTAIAYTVIGNDKFTSFPASAALLIIIPYSLAIIVTLVFGIVLDKIYKNKKNK